MKIVFITSLFGNGDNPAKFQRIDGFDYFLFSDREQKTFDTSWDVHNISSNPNISNINCNIRKSRYAKFMGWELLDSIGINYDCIYYCDAHWSPRPNIDWLNTSNSFLSSSYPFLQLTHPECHDKGIAYECEIIPVHFKDSESNMAKTLNFFQNNFPEISLSAKQYFENTIFGYYPNDLVKKVIKDFWQIYTKSDITFRDQPTWNLMLLKHGVKPQTKPNLKDLFEETGECGDHHYV